MSNNEKICFLTEANYPNYIKRFKEFNLKRYLELDLKIPYYISTNMVEEFSEYKNNHLIKVFHIDDLRKDNSNSLKNELLPSDPTGIYPARYPWNLRRFILKKAAEDGYLSLFFLECDTRIRFGFDKETLQDFLLNLYEPNTVKTSSTRFVYKNRHPNQELFYYHKNYIDDFNFKFKDDDYDTLDGTNQLFFSDSYENFETFFKNWNMIADYGYDKKHGYKTGYLSNLSFVIPMSKFKLINTETPFETHHVFDDRY
jgi:hypothetical protein